MKKSFRFLNINIKDKKLSKYLCISIEVIAIMAVFLVSRAINKSNYIPTNWGIKPDIFYEYTAAVEIGNGINPYNKILNGNLVSNNKYATLLPLYYYMLLAVSKLSGSTFDGFYANYRKVIFIFQCAAFLFTYLKFRKHNKKLLGFMAASFLILNRWSVGNIASTKQDTIAIALLLGSFYFFDTKRRLAYLLYGFSLGIKHLGIFLFPIYLLPFLTKDRKTKDVLVDMACMFCPVLIPSIYFIINNASSFFLSMLFSFTRAPESGNGSTCSNFGYENLLVLYKAQKHDASLLLLLLPRVPLVVFSILNVFLLLTLRISKYSYALFAMIIFISFNPVYFDQYLLWMTPVIFYIYFDFLDVNKEKTTILLKTKS